MENKFHMTRNAIMNADSPEYFWVEKLVSENMPKDQVIMLIIKCLGGNETIADNMINVVKNKSTKTYFANLVENYNQSLQNN